MKTEPNIDTLLKSGAHITLSNDEKAEMKLALLSHATQTLQYEKRKGHMSWHRLLFPTVATFASLLIMFVGTGYASTHSLPGETLYGVKVHMIEEIVALTKIDSNELVTYDIVRMETRLLELQQLSKTSEITGKNTLDDIHKQITKHTNHATLLLLDSFNTEITPEQKVEYLSDLASVTKAQENIIDTNSEFLQLQERMNETRNKSISSLEKGVENYVEGTTENDTLEYLSDVMTEISDDIQDTKPEISVQQEVGESLLNASEKLTSGDEEEALLSTLEAQQTLDIHEYLQDNESENQ